MEVAGPLRTPLSLAQRKRASPRGEAGTSVPNLSPEGEVRAGGHSQGLPNVHSEAGLLSSQDGGCSGPGEVRGKWLGFPVGYSTPQSFPVVVITEGGS